MGSGNRNRGKGGRTMRRMFSRMPQDKGIGKSAAIRTGQSDGSNMMCGDGSPPALVGVFNTTGERGYGQ